MKKNKLHLRIGFVLIEHFSFQLTVDKQLDDNNYRIEIPLRSKYYSITSVQRSKKTSHSKPPNYISTAIKLYIFFQQLHFFNNKKKNEKKQSFFSIRKFHQSEIIELNIFFE